MSTVESLGKYVIRRQLGRGAMGTVYEGFDPVIERVVAIKTVRLPEVADDETAEEIARFRREAQAAGRLTHPNIVGVFDYGETADLAYIVMEYVDGPPLKNLLDKNERFPLPRIVEIMQDLLAGLQFSHERGVVHRDIKPANLMLTQLGQAKIADFGIARIESSSMTQAGTVLGTPAYMSPEQFMGQVVDARSDIYSSGVLLYQLLTGERPFEGSMSAIMHKALNTEAPMPSQISVTAPRPFDEVVRRAMAKRPDDRYSSAAEFMAAIRSAAMAPPPPVEAPTRVDEEATMVVAPRPAASRSSDMSVKMLAASISPPPAVARPTVDAGASSPSSKKSSPLPIIIGACVVGLAALGGGGYYLLTPTTSPKQETVTPPGPEKVTPPKQETVTPPGPEKVTPPKQETVTPPGPEKVTPPKQETVTPPGPEKVTPPKQETVTPPGPEKVTPPKQETVTPPRPETITPPRQETVQPPVDPYGAMRAEIAAFVAGLPCSLADGDIRDGAVQVNGIAGKTAIDSLRQKLTAMGLVRPPPSLRVTQIVPVFCSLVDLLRPIARPFGDGGGVHLTLHLQNDPSFLKKDEYILPRLTMADFRGELRVEYLDHEGAVQHLYPQLGNVKERVAADPPRVFEPGEPLNLGEPRPDNRGWQVDQPFGTDMIVAIATEDQLFDQPRLSNVEKADDYLQDLKRAVDAARARGAKITATAIPVETRRR